MGENDVKFTRARALLGINESVKFVLPLLWIPQKTNYEKKGKKRKGNKRGGNLTPIEKESKAKQKSFPNLQCKQ